MRLNLSEIATGWSRLMKSCCLYLQAPSASDSEKQQCLDDLLLFPASPVVRNTLRERLGIHVSLAGSTSRHHVDLTSFSFSDAAGKASATVVEQEGRHKALQ